MYLFYHDLYVFFIYYVTDVLLRSIALRAQFTLGAGIACWYSTGLVIERWRVQIPAGVAGEFSSPELTLFADSSSVSAPSPCYRSGT